MTLLLLLACRSDAPGDSLGPHPRPDLDDTASPTDDTAGPDACEADPTLVVEAIDHSQPWTAHELEVTVDLSSPAAVALRCALVGDPEEVHLVEGSDPRSRHTLRLAGLLADASYACEVVPTCPESLGSAIPFQVETGADPSDMIRPEAYTWEARAGSEYVLTNLSDDCDWPTQLLVVWDRDARPRWYYRTPDWVGPSVEFRYHGDDTFEWGGGWSPNSEARPRLVDLYEGEFYDSAEAMADYRRTWYHHDGKLMDDGRLATLEESNVSSEYGNFKGFSVRFVDPGTDAVEFTYDSQRAYDEGHLPYAGGDAWHANWVDVEVVDEREVMYVSLCYLYWTIAVDAQTGEWLWSFGRNGDFALLDEDGNPLDSGEFPQCQHGLEKSGNNLLVYDNGWERGYSRVIEYELDESTMTARRLWTWTEPDWYESTLGDADYLPSGNILVGAGHADCFSSNPGDVTTVSEVDPVAGEKLWELRYPDSGMMAYRADWADACELFANARYCPSVADRVAELEPLFTR